MHLLFLLKGMAFAAASLASTTADLVRAEKAFAADSATLGVNQAFRKNLADDAWIFRPYPVPAAGWLARQTTNPKGLAWNPQFVEVAASGDLGLSIGPWRFSSQQAGKTSASWGHFMSIWKRGGDGTWKVVVDHGVNHGEVGIDVQIQPLHASAPSAPVSDATRQARLLELERVNDQLSTSLRTGDVPAAYRRVASDDVLLLRNGQLPVPGVLPSSLQSTRQGVGSAPRVDAGISLSGDFGYTVGGNDTPESARFGVYERAWRHNGTTWQLTADVTDDGT